MYISDTYIGLYMDFPEQTDANMWVLYDIGISAVITGICIWYRDYLQILGLFSFEHFRCASKSVFHVYQPFIRANSLV